MSFSLIIVNIICKSRLWVGRIGMKLDVPCSTSFYDATYVCDLGNVSNMREKTQLFFGVFETDLPTERHVEVKILKQTLKFP